jgi:Protein of unknown function (DUF3558)
VGGARGAIVIVVLLVLTGCTTTGGTPAPADPPPTSTVPARPRDVPINGVDPCSLLTEEQRAELGLDGRPVLDRSPSLLFPGDVSMCVIRGFNPRAIIVSVGLVTTAGIEFFSSENLAADLASIGIAGFPAAVARPTQYTQFCNVVVDVAPGQLLDVQAQDGGRQPPIPQEQLCQDAEQAATAVMETLLAVR